MGYKELKLALQNDITFSNELDQIHMLSTKDENSINYVMTNVLNENFRAI